MNMLDKLKKIWDITTNVLVALVVLAAVFLMGSRLLGYQVYNVASGSMAPIYNEGDLIYVKQVDPDSIREGQVITFVLNEELTVATHGVVRIDKENRHFYTKGEANDTPDAAPVHFNNLIGTPVFSIPLLGYVSAYIQHPPGMYVAIGLGIALVGAVFLPDLIKKKPAPKKGAEEEETPHE